ncbi:DUF1273 domain-containing protein [Vagococcus elongatus]|uniref:UPF0398 protein CBF29_00990 n=1 Tax=Vagococcus elongatus TaxID=180344 RepID=A0A430B5U8_9ENTE|nr:DUF1273 domain-containing protein [Vagococcus elongatus]RSU15680.1 hypothetical protein CBF29_00990 [Vagococcus elongatus]
MKPIKTLYVSGYRSFELGIFQEKDPKITIIKRALKKSLKMYLEAGLEWVIISGNLGVEFWTSEVIPELKTDYPELKLGLIFPFYEFGNNWNEDNQQKLLTMKNNADYENSTSHQPYTSPVQLKNHTKFLLEKTQGCLLVYDPEYSGKTEYFYRDALKFQADEDYLMETIGMFELQDIADE